MTGAELIAEERQRQVDEEGWDSECDDERSTGSLAVAGACYALAVAGTHAVEVATHVNRIWRADCSISARKLWPWDKSSWKPTHDDPIRQLAKAGALIAAEIDKLQRRKERVERELSEAREDKR